MHILKIKCKFPKFYYKGPDTARKQVCSNYDLSLCKDYVNIIRYSLLVIACAKHAS